MNQIIAKSFKDLFSGTVLLFIIKSTFVSLLMTIAMVWYSHHHITAFVQHYLKKIPWEWLQTTGVSIATVVIGYMLFVALHSMVTSFMIEPLLIKLAHKHYPDTPFLGSPNTITSILITLRATLSFFIIFLISFPLMFVPLLGALYMLWLWSILIKAPTIYDVGSMFIADKQALQHRTSKTTLLAMIAAGLNYIPLLNIFSPVFAQILFLHRIVGKEA